jgi:redox-sensitive bicupin YhaK (pirin superfamily)
VSVRVVPGEVSSKDATTRAVVPTSALARWPPFERVAETIVTTRRRLPPHRHEHAEVLTYTIEGTGRYDFGSAPPSPLAPGSVNLLYAPTGVTHAISAGDGHTVRYLAVVATVPAGAPATPRLQTARPDARPQPDGSISRAIVGLGSAVTSTVGLECEALEFGQDGTAFRKVGHARLGIAYVVSGRGRIDNQEIEAGEAAAVEEASGVAISGRPGFQVVLTTAPRPA